MATVLVNGLSWHLQLKSRGFCCSMLMAPLTDNWKRPPEHPRIMWLNTVQRDLRAYNLTLNKAVDLVQNRPLCRLMSTYSAMHS